MEQSQQESSSETGHYGNSSPLGASIGRGGVNFSVYSRSAEAIELLLFDHEDDACASRIIPINPVRGRTYHYWHVFVPGLKAGQIYAYRAFGEHDPSSGMRFSPEKVLLDPYGRMIVVPSAYSREAARSVGNNMGTSMKSVVVDPSTYDWEGDVHPRHPSSRSIVYELHVRGFTRHPSSGVPVEKRGTYAGLIEKIPYLQALGITAVEFLPVFQFDPQDAPAGLTNYWGYAPVSFFAPHGAYSSRRDPLNVVDEFRDMVKALHRGGIEVILDVVYNHTAEGSHEGPTICFRGLDNSTYYILEEDRSRYANYSGTGNTLNANHPIVRRMILDSLRYWVEVMHVDGFRFDLASILSRDQLGHPLPHPPVLWDIESDPALAGTKLIAEAWDAAGLYQVGNFIGDAWKEWNGRFRDDVRSYFRGDPGSVSRVADRLLGSPQIYGHKEREAEQSVNFVTCHDGFTLNDLVSYSYKHNEDNLEGNRDGCNDNRSWNCGVEGPTADSAVELLRHRQIKNMLAINLLSLGMPMILMGDEMRRTQRGNNNAYCQDNNISWLDWSLLEKHADLYRFVSLLCARRLLRSMEPEERRMSLNEMISHAKHSWHGVKLGEPDWSEYSRCIALSVEVPDPNMILHFILNGSSESHSFELPDITGSERVPWRLWIDTSLTSPNDIVAWQDSPVVSGASYEAGGNSVVVVVKFLKDEKSAARGEA